MRKEAGDTLPRLVRVAASLRSQHGATRPTSHNTPGSPSMTVSVLCVRGSLFPPFAFPGRADKS
ncbi:hypothetical protein E2C01_073159 [Portunus trituberculatus]|uniref:Uncharacterized protein n=1 Tax=Portunus trituberculatus TaxID=210409 RepID=A0A5B7I947_PORTR|nr:hypothetical protein [Portunus trituberculatus]